MKSEINHALQLYKENRYSWITKNILKIDREEVTLMQRKNHHYLNCTCQSSGTTGNASICRHKFLFMYLPFLERTNRKIDELIDFYKVAQTQYNDEAKKVTGFFLSDLEELKRLKL